MLYPYLFILFYQLHTVFQILHGFKGWAIEHQISNNTNFGGGVSNLTNFITLKLGIECTSLFNNCLKFFCPFSEFHGFMDTCTKLNIH